LDKNDFGRLLRTGRKAVDNDAFLEAMFAEAAPDTHTIVATIKGDPNDPDLDRRCWGGRAWLRGKSTRRLGVNDDANNYLTISAFNRGPDGSRRRVKAQFSQLCAVMLDDLGVKLDPQRVALPLSAAVVTSPGNVQGWHFVRRNAAALDRATCETLINAMVEEGFAAARDPGMKGVTRFGRLPVGKNHKSAYGSNGFECRLVLWEPQRTFTVEEIAKAYGIWPLRVAHVPKAHRLTDAQRRRYGTQFTSTVKTLEAAGLVKGFEARAGKYELTCPWVHEHTNGADTGTALFAPSKANDGRGGFRCHHGHCERRTLWDVKAWVAERGMAAIQRTINGTLSLRRA
jgi:hypothetical protein